jgi:integrase/recombinase XerC
MPGLVPYTGDALQTTQRWVNWEPAERKRRAAEAARDRDLATLTELLCVHLQLYGKAGARASKYTIRNYCQAVRTLLEAWQGVSLLRASRDEAAMLVRRWEASGAAHSTITVRLAGIRALYAALRWTECTQADPFKDVHPAPDHTPAHAKRQPYDDAAVDRLLAIAEGEDWLLVLLGSHAGLRASEIVDLRWEAVDLDAGTLTVVNGKGGKRRDVPLSRSLHAALREAVGTGYVISAYRTTETARAHMESLCRQAGIRYRALHSMRHTAGTRIYKATGRLEDAQHLLGHSDISTTQIYAHYADAAVRNALSDW